MLLGGIVLGLLAGLLAGGRIDNLVRVRLHWLPLLFGAIVLRFLTDGLVAQNVGPIDALRLPLYAISYGLLTIALWRNRRHPGLSLAMVGVLSNGIAIVGNGGFMPVWARSLEAAGFDQATATSSFHVVLPATLDASFLLHAGPISDLLPIPVPLIQSVASIGDVFLAFGLSFFLFATLVRAPGELDLELTAIADGYRTSTGQRGRPDPWQTDRGLTLSTGSGTLAAALPVLGFPTGPVPMPRGPDLMPAGAVPVPVARPPLPAALERLRGHPYVRLALNGSYSAMWIGQLISLFGDRVHQIALAFLVFAASGHSALAVAFVFVFATVPNLVLGPIAGTAVDRWDQKQVMIVSDLLRASIVLLVPIAAVTNILLVYPLIFLVTSISIFFRPARAAVTPRIVLPDELMTANSAAWVGETLADVVGYPIAGVFVAFLGAELPLAFWIDSATYTASALLVASMTIPPLRRAVADAAGAAAGSVSEGKPNRFVADMLQGWRFLRREPVLLANTIQGAAGQFMTGAVTALTPIYVATVLAPTAFGNSGAYAFVEMAIGIGNLVGGFAVGLIGARMARGRMVIVGYTIAGLGTALLALTVALPVAIGLAAGVGVANMVFVIPSQTLFQERTPADMIGRVVGMRFSLVYGSMTLAMALSGVAAGAVGVAPVFFVTGLLCAAAGLGGLLIPAVRQA